MQIIPLSEYVKYVDCLHILFDMGIRVRMQLRIFLVQELSGSRFPFIAHSLISPGKWAPSQLLHPQLGRHHGSLGMLIARVRIPGCVCESVCYRNSCLIKAIQIGLLMVKGEKSHVVPPLDKDLQATNECRVVELSSPRD